MEDSGPDEAETQQRKRKMARIAREIADHNGRGSWEALEEPRRRRSKPQRLSETPVAPQSQKRRKAAAAAPPQNKAAKREQAAAPTTMKMPRRPVERSPATRDDLQGRRVKELKEIAKKQRVDISGLLEKDAIVDALVDARVPASPREDRPAASPPEEAAEPVPESSPLDDAADSSPLVFATYASPSPSPSKPSPTPSESAEEAAAAEIPEEEDGGDDATDGLSEAAVDALVAGAESDGDATADAPDLGAEAVDAETLAAARARAPPGVIEAWAAAGHDFEDQLAFALSREAGAQVIADMEQEAAELCAKAAGLAFFAAEARRKSGAASAASALNDEERKAAPEAEALHDRATRGDMALREAVRLGSAAYARSSAYAKVLAAAAGVQNALSVVGKPGCLEKETVVFTGVCETLGRDKTDTQGYFKEIVVDLGGTCRDAVNGNTTVLLVGRGEKGEGGRRDGKGASPTTSAKYRNALEENERRAEKTADEEQKRSDREAELLANPRLKKKYVSKSFPPIRILYEEEFLDWLATLDAGAAEAPAAAEAAGAKETLPPKVAPSLTDIRYSPRRGAAHGRGEPGRDGAILADALAAPAGFTLDNALISSGEQLNGAFAHTMLQRCSCADGAENDFCESYVTVSWSGAGGLYRQVDDDDEAAAADEGDAHQSKWLAARARPAFKTKRGAKFEACRTFDHADLDDVVSLRRKPLLGPQYGLLADTPEESGMGQAHAKWFLLRFASLAGDEHIVRLVVSSGNCAAISYAGFGSRQLVGLWWADFPEVEAPAPSPFRDALLRHARALVTARTATKQDVAADRERALERCEALFDACARADFALADAAGVALVASVPGVHARDANFGEDAVAAAFRAAARSPDEQLDCAVVCHSFGGFGGPASSARLAGIQRALAPGGGHLSLLWPERDDIQLIHHSRRPEVGHRPANDSTRTIRDLKENARLVRLRAPRDDRGSSKKFVWTPHLMLYVLHEPDVLHGQPPEVRRVLLTSANLSAAAWGRRRSAARPDDKEACDDAGALEIRSFELGVSVPVAPDAARAFPFAWPPTSAGDCAEPFVGNRSLDEAHKGTLYY